MKTFDLIEKNGTLFSLCKKIDGISINQMLIMLWSMNLLRRKNVSSSQFFQWFSWICVKTTLLPLRIQIFMPKLVCQIFESLLVLHFTDPRLITRYSHSLLIMILLLYFSMLMIFFFLLTMTLLLVIELKSIQSWFKIKDLKKLNYFFSIKITNSIRFI